MSELSRFLPDELTGQVILRAPTCDDVDKVLGYFESLGERSRGFFHPHPFDRENAERLCREDSPAWYRVVAEADGRIVGCAWFAPWKDYACPTVGIGIADDFQGKRLGGALMDALIAEAGERGLPGLRLSVYPDNERALRLYTSRGFRIVGRERKEHAMEVLFDPLREETHASHGSCTE